MFILAGSAAVGLCIWIAWQFSPVNPFFAADTKAEFLKWLEILFVCYIAYIILHELTHAAVMKAVGGGKVRFGFIGLCAYAGSLEDYFDKTSYCCIALAPVIVWGIVLGFLSAVLPQSWFWIIWFIQAGNLGGSVYDIYVTIKLRRMPSTILVQDTGYEMTVYDKA